jgi:hypothetical protein
MTDGHYLTLSPENAFSFKCPIFDAEVSFKSCLTLRHRVYMGKSTPTRSGCQACIVSSKCPAAEIVRRIAMKGSDVTDHCSSTTPVTGKLPIDVLERVARVVVLESAMLRFNVPLDQRQLIETADKRIAEQMLTAPAGSQGAKNVIRSSSVEDAKPRRNLKMVDVDMPPKPAEKPKPVFSKAAASGDLSAAINANPGV